MGSRGRVSGDGAKPPEAETLLAFGRSTKAANLIFRNAKSHRCLCCLAKMMFNKS